jgi:hypothetical protein
MTKRKMGWEILFRQKTGASTYKYFAGTTANGFDLTPEIKESITKADVGQKKKRISGYTSEFSVDGMYEVNEAADEATSIDVHDMIGFILNKTELEFSYGTSTVGETSYTGKAIMTKYSEKSDSENEATYSCSFALTGALTPVVNA